MTKRFGFHKNTIMEYRTFAGGQQDAESEWLFPSALMQQLVDDAGESLVLKSKAKHGGEYRYDFTPRGKQDFPIWLASKAKAKDFERWAPLIEELAFRLKNVQAVEDARETIR